MTATLSTPVIERTSPSLDLRNLIHAAAADLRGCLHPVITNETRRQQMTFWRTEIARQLAKDETGVDWYEARLTAIYSRSQLSARQIERSKTFKAAIERVYATLPEDFSGLLRFCDDYAFLHAA